jgi:hypothetical protein
MSTVVGEVDHRTGATTELALDSVAAVQRRHESLQLVIAEGSSQIRFGFRLAQEVLGDGSEHMPWIETRVSRRCVGRGEQRLQLLPEHRVTTLGIEPGAPCGLRHVAASLE